MFEGASYIGNNYGDIRGDGGGYDSDSNDDNGAGWCGMDDDDNGAGWCGMDDDDNGDGWCGMDDGDVCFDNYNDILIEISMLVLLIFLVFFI